MQRNGIVLIYVYCIYISFTTAVSNQITENVAKHQTHRHRYPVIALQRNLNATNENAVFRSPAQPPQNNQPGCNVLPSCSRAVNAEAAGGEDCATSEYHADRCWRNVFYQCSYTVEGHGVLNPFICPAGLVVNPVGIAGRSDSEPSSDSETHSAPICDWPSNVVSNLKSPPNPGCGCAAECTRPPVCPPPQPHQHDHVAPSSKPPSKAAAGQQPNCNRGNCHHKAILFPFACDRQFFWVCNGQVPVMQACGANKKFVAQPNNGGVCQLPTRLS